MSDAHTLSPVTLSARAANRISRILRAEPQGAVLRIGVNGGGCSGFKYDFDIALGRADDDLVVERDGAVVVIDPVSLEFMKGAEIDFVDDLIGQSFKINNPNATASCGCGTSFSV
jgi:iron-sulfur cluster assembly accessory protein